MDEWVVYYNAKCGTCRNVVEILEKKGIKPRLVEYLKNPPSLKELDRLLHKLRLSPKEIIREKEPVYEKLKLGEGQKSRLDLLRAIAENPVLLQRPIVVRGHHQAVVARPAEKVNELF